MDHRSVLKNSIRERAERAKQEQERLNELQVEAARRTVVSEAAPRRLSKLRGLLRAHQVDDMRSPLVKALEEGVLA